ncbi:hypothetical protein HNQ80_000095 [Anaerosolibacter carboniphilus]|uniref:Uncharacterized protein n=1 Tax=Anaerosolibacter carboniphilus TaxID=1417629 RepID=A0A841KL09_9FIRM|nr:hypothetical protein [Anaerosolibacter carboniphilus]MBB6214026.1 hypothetical protein [Anaerosolibacter carboniphilus]
MKKSMIVCFILLLCMGSAVYGDDAVLGGRGNTVYPIYDTQVEMLSEHVDIEVKGEYSLVRCEFLFRNAGEKETVMVGFPAYGTLPPREDRASFGDDEKLYDFKTYVDGKEQNTVIKEGLKEEGNNLGRMYYANWYVWEMKFDKGQERRVVNTYRIKNSYDSIGGKTVKYILETGATWKNSIGYGKVSIRFDQKIDPQNINIVDYQEYENQPNVAIGVYPEDNKITWEFFDLEPDFNIELYYQEPMERQRYLIFDSVDNGENKEKDMIKKYGLTAYKAYMSSDDERALEAIKKVNSYKEHGDEEIASYALEVSNFLDYYRGLIHMKRGDTEGAIYYLKLNGLLQDRNLYLLSQLYKTSGNLDQYIQMLNRMTKGNVYGNVLRLWANQEQQALPQGIKVKYDIDDSDAKVITSKESVEEGVKAETKKQEDFSYKGFILFNMGIVIFIFVIFWNIKKR